MYICCDDWRLTQFSLASIGLSLESLWCYNCDANALHIGTVAGQNAQFLFSTSLYGLSHSLPSIKLTKELLNILHKDNNASIHNEGRI